MSPFEKARLFKHRFWSDYERGLWWESIPCSLPFLSDALYPPYYLYATARNTQELIDNKWDNRHAQLFGDAILTSLRAYLQRMNIDSWRGLQETFVIPGTIGWMETIQFPEELSMYTEAILKFKEKVYGFSY